jgi:hypothetical protein
MVPIGLKDATDSDASTDSFGELLKTNSAMVNTDARIPTAHSTVFISRFCGVGGGTFGFVLDSRFGCLRLPMTMQLSQVPKERGVISK